MTPILHILHKFGSPSLYFQHLVNLMVDMALHVRFFASCTQYLLPIFIFFSIENHFKAVCFLSISESVTTSLPKRKCLQRLDIRVETMDFLLLLTSKSIFVLSITSLSPLVVYFLICSQKFPVEKVSPGFRHTVRYYGSLVVPNFQVCFFLSTTSLCLH